jgi:hypothetical protein
MDCESCGSTNKVEPVKFREVPMVLVLCSRCRGAGVIPYDLLVTSVWLGQIRATDAWARNVAFYHGRSSAEFEADAANFSDKMDEAFKEE